MDEYQPGLEAAVRVRVPERPMAEIEQMLPNQWLPLSLSRFVVEAAIDELGRERAPMLWGAFFARRYIRVPVLKTFIDGGMRIFGGTPGTFARLFPRGFPSTYKDFATVQASVDKDHDHASMLFEDVASAVFEFPSYFVVFQGVFKGFYEITKHDGEVTMELEPDESIVRYQLKWWRAS